MNLIEERNKLIEEIDDGIAEFRTKRADMPKFLILSLAHRAAIKHAYPSYTGGLDPRAFCGIEIIKKEEVIIL
uniref:Uncharacterized protein n=1 Tax=viral metagenome TaxID=1070528 RepID=A0A6M3X6X9_9ZZZZ